MPTFEIQGHDGKIYDIDAPDENSALQAFQDFSTDYGKFAQPGTYEDGHVSQTLSGANEGLANLMGAPVDLANAGIGLGMKGVNALAGTDFQPSERPFLGSEQIAGWMGKVGAIAPESRDPAKQFTRRVGEELGAAAIPGLGMVGAGSRLARKGLLTNNFMAEALKQSAKKPGKFLATETGLAASSGAGAGAAQHFAPDNPLAEMGGQFIGGFSPVGVTAAARKIWPNKAGRMSVEDLGNAAKAAYESAEKEGVTYLQEGLEGLHDSIKQDLTSDGFHPALHPGADVAQKELARVAKGNATLKGVDVARKITSKAYKPGERENNLFLARIIEHIDDFILNAKPGRDVVADGDPVRGAKALKDAHGLYRRRAKLDEVERMLLSADLQAASTGSGGNINNAIRQKLKTLIDPAKNKGRGYTAEEKKLLAKVVKGTWPQWGLRLAGKLAPGGNGLMFGANTAHALYNPGLGMPMMAAGAGSKMAADALTHRNGQDLLSVIANGGVSPPPRKKLTERQRVALSTLLIGQAAANPISAFGGR